MRALPPPFSLVGMLRLVAAAVLLVAERAAAQSDFGAPCSINSCSCAGFCLSGEKGKVIDTPPDDDGYAYKFSLCAVIPEEQLPTGCRDLSTDATVVRYKVRRCSSFCLSRPPTARHLA